MDKSDKPCYHVTGRMCRPPRFQASTSQQAASGGRLTLKQAANIKIKNDVQPREAQRISICTLQQPVIVTNAHKPLSAKFAAKTNFDEIWIYDFVLSAARAVPDARVVATLSMSLAKLTCHRHEN